MTYYSDEHVVIRHMQPDDVDAIHSENLSRGWHSNKQVYENYQTCCEVND